MFCSLVARSAVQDRPYLWPRAVGFADHTVRYGASRPCIQEAFYPDGWPGGQLQRQPTLLRPSKGDLVGDGGVTSGDVEALPSPPAGLGALQLLRALATTTAAAKTTVLDSLIACLLRPIGLAFPAKSRFFHPHYRRRNS